MYIETLGVRFSNPLVHTMSPWETNIMSVTEFKTFSDSISISSDEETRLGISENLHVCSIVMSEVYNNHRMNVLPTVRDFHGVSPRRTRQSVPIYTVPQPFTLLYQIAPLLLITSCFNDVFCFPIFQVHIHSKSLQ
jgi:hypothetical protein